MTWTSERATVNQIVQIGPEASGAMGTPVAAGKIIQELDIKPGIKMELTTYRSVGHRYPAAQEVNKEWSELPISGNLDYNTLVYIIASAYGRISPAAHGTSTIAKDWVSNPQLTGLTAAVEPQTYTLQQGDQSRAAQFAGCFVSGWGYKLTRKDANLTAKMLGQKTSDGVSLSSTPTAIAIAAMLSKHFNVYLDSTQAGLGTTQLAKILSVEFADDNIRGPTWFLNRSNESFSATVETVPTGKGSILLEADSTGMAPLTYVRAGTKYYLRVDAVGSEIDTATTPHTTNAFQHDMCILFAEPKPWTDSDGVFAIEYPYSLAEDLTWGQAQKLTVTNLITAL